jgi:hypothetical protein
MDPELLLIARGSAWGRELLLGLGDVVARTRSARGALLELIRVAVLGAGTGQRHILRLPQGCLAIPILLTGIGEETTSRCIIGVMITARNLPGVSLGVLRFAATW